MNTFAFVVSRMNKENGIYENILVFTNVPKFKDVFNHLHDKETALLMIEKFSLGNPHPCKIYYSIEEFEENEINI